MRSDAITIKPVEQGPSRHGVASIGSLLGWGVVVGIVGATGWPVVEWQLPAATPP